MTLNKKTNTPGNTTGFSANINVISRWVKNATYQAEF